MSHRAEAADLSVLVTFGIADALGDSEARDWARKQMALDYVRSLDEQQQEKKGSQAAPKMQEAS